MRAPVTEPSVYALRGRGLLPAGSPLLAARRQHRGREPRRGAGLRSDGGGRRGCSSDSGGDPMAARPDGTPARRRDARTATGHRGRGRAITRAFTGLHCGRLAVRIGLAAGGGHVCALLVDTPCGAGARTRPASSASGTLDAGRIVPSQTPTPTPVAGLAGVAQIAAGGYSTGSGFVRDRRPTRASVLGQQRNGGPRARPPHDGGARRRGRSLPCRSRSAPSPSSRSAAFSAARSTADGGVACWGDNSESELGRALDAGSFDPTPASVPLRERRDGGGDGQVPRVRAAPRPIGRVLGRRRSGPDWAGLRWRRRRRPRMVAGLSATQLSAGDGSTCAITTAGGVECWGGNQSGQLGRGDSTDPPSPSPSTRSRSPWRCPPGRTRSQIASAVGEHVRAPLGPQRLVLGRQRVRRARDRLGRPRLLGPACPGARARERRADRVRSGRLDRLRSAPGGQCPLLGRQQTPTSSGSTRRATRGPTRGRIRSPCASRSRLRTRRPPTGFPRSGASGRPCPLGNRPGQGSVASLAAMNASDANRPWTCLERDRRRRFRWRRVPATTWRADRPRRARPTPPCATRRRGPERATRYHPSRRTRWRPGRTARCRDPWSERRRAWPSWRAATPRCPT